MIKSKDLYLVLVIIGITALLSFFISGAIFKPSKVKTVVEVVVPITNDFPAPDTAYFNKNSLNPTQTITIGDGNPNPFNNQ